jgi:hypothetical protein
VHFTTRSSFVLYMHPELWMSATDSSGKLLIGSFLAFGSFLRSSHLGLTREPSLAVEAFSSALYSTV